MLRELKGRLSDAAFGLFTSPMARRVRREHLTYLKAKKLTHMEHELRRLRKQRIMGDYLEFGVALGGSAILIAQGMPQGSRFHGFDVFGMIPPPTSDKDDEKSRRRYEVIRSGDSKGLGGDRYYGYRDDLFDAVSRSFSTYGLTVDQERISLHKGLFETTWPKASERMGAVAFAHIDCDWYDPVQFCLRAVSERMTVGGVIIIDDYNDYGGCRAATDEFLRENPKFRMVRNFGNVIIRRT